MKISTTYSLLSLIWVYCWSFVVWVDAQDDTDTEVPIFSPNDCDRLNPASIVFSYIRSRNPNEVVFFTFQDIPGNLVLFLTDNAWTGNGFAANEGTLQFVVPAEGIPQATNFGYGPSARFGSQWIPVEGAFSLGREQVILYCIGASAQLLPIAAISWNGPFSPPGLENYGMNMSALPARLNTTDSETGEFEFPGSFLELGALRHCEVWEYDGIQSAERDRLQRAMGNPSNWKGSECLSVSAAASTQSYIGSIITRVLGIFAMGWIVLW